MSLTDLMRTGALSLTLAACSLLSKGCMLDRSGLFTPRPDAAADGGMEPDGAIEADAAFPDDGGRMDGGPLVVGSQYVPAPIRPSLDEILPPTRAFLSWREGEIPAGQTIAGYELCRTAGLADEIDEDSECPDNTLLLGLFQVWDPLMPNATYRWKVRARFDDGRYSAWSAVQVFSTDDSLVLWLRLNGNATDSSTTGPDGTLRNGAGFADGIDAEALQCDGNNDYLDLGGSLALPGPLTISVWAHGNGLPTSSDSGLLNQGSLNYALTYHTNGQAYFYIGDGGNNLHAPMSPDAWHHLAGIFDGSTALNGMRLFLDGVPAGVRASSIAATGATGDLSIGRYDTSHFNGRIDNVTIYSGALTAESVLNEYCATQASGDVDPLPAPCEP